MPVTKYQYLITDTANDKVYIPQLTYEIDNDDLIVIKVDHINVGIEPGKCDIYMADVLTAPQKTALDAGVAAHQGFGINATMQGTLQLVNLERDIISDVPWEVVGGIVTTPSFFDPSMTQIIARITGEHKGDGGQLQIVEEMEGEANEDKITPAFNFPDVGAVWTRFKVDSNVPPRDGLRNIYRTDARLDGAVSLSLRYATISMIVVKIV